MNIGYLKNHCLNHIIYDSSVHFFTVYSLDIRIAQVSDVTHRPPVVVLIKGPVVHSNVDPISTTQNIKYFLHKGYLLKSMDWHFHIHWEMI